MSALLDLAVKSTVLLGCAGVVVALMRRATASSRHLIWTGAFFAIALLPVARVAMPAWRIAVLAAPEIAAGIPLDRPGLKTRPSSSSEMEGRISTAMEGRVFRPAQTAPIPPPRSTPIALADVLTTLWLLGAVALVARSIAGWIALRQSVRQARPVTEPRIIARLQEMTRRLHIRRPIALLSVDSDGVPCTFGLRHAVILVPASLLAADASANARLDAVLSHEMRTSPGSMSWPTSSFAPASSRTGSIR